MSDTRTSEFQKSGFDLVARPAVSKRDRQYGPLLLESLPGTTVVQILGNPDIDQEAEVAARIGEPLGIGLRNTAPGQWLLVRDAAPTPAGLEALAASLSGIAAVVDQSSGRARFRVGGIGIRRVLAKGTGVDLHESVFPVGRSCMTLIGHFGVNLTRTGEDAFELLVLRGFAEDLWHELEMMSSEFA